jgi:trimeric autotransporter adhesin
MAQTRAKLATEPCNFTESWRSIRLGKNRLVESQSSPEAGQIQKCSVFQSSRNLVNPEMSVMTPTQQNAWSSAGAKLQSMWIAFAAIAVFWLLSVGTVHAASPLAGTSIGNQASATYVDGSAVTRSVSSNLVTTTVQQVAALTITQSLAKTAAAGTQVSYPVTLTNTGNGTDSFALTQTNTGGFAFTSVTFYADANGDGVADNTTPITTTGSLAPGAVFRFVAVGNVPTTATTLATDVLVITATSGFAPAVLASVTDTTTITANAVISVTKTMSAVSGPSPSTAPHTITLSYSNTGNIAATGVTLTDALPAGMTYVPGSGRWSVTGATVLTDATADLQGPGPTIDYSVTGTTVKGIVNTVAAGQSGTLTFQVSIDANLAAAPLNNTATFAYNDGVAAVPVSNTNTFVFTVNQTASVSALGATVTSAAQGSTVTFSNVFTNTGNGTDSFDVTVGTSTFPAGSSFALYKADGVTPLVDTNGNGIPDTGPVTGILTAPNNTYTVVLKVTLPAGVTGGPYSVSKTATSKFDPTKTATAVDTLQSITANSVDLNQGATLALGFGPFANNTTAIVTNSTNPGTTTRFTLNVVNAATSTGDTFNLAASTDSTFGSLALPAGWTVVFRDSAGTVITNTSIVATGATAVVFADVTVPAGQAAIPAGQPITFRVLSPSTGSTDRITDSVIVNTIRSVTITPNNVGQIVPGASVIYTHTITNAGNVTENALGGSTVTLSLAQTQAGFTAIVYLDANNNNIIDAGEVAINTAADLGPLLAGTSKQLLVKVTASSGVGIGVLDTATLTATTAVTINGVAAPAVASATDATTVISGNIVLLKEQALDANCDGTPDTAYSVATITTGAIPGACIRYRVTATNNGSADVVSLVLSDATPVATTYISTNPAATVPVSTVTAPASGSAGTISAAIGTLTPSAAVVLTFGVKINP